MNCDLCDDPLGEVVAVPWWDGTRKLCSACLCEVGYCEVGEHYDELKAISGYPRLEDERWTIAFCEDHEAGICQALVNEAAAAGLSPEEARRSLARYEADMAAELARLITEEWPRPV